ncbi:sialate O-acetylesterase [uncultured Bacteroides sp.]|uniref:sialate O-acetylesterase n=1 Tax=uncultured Bacteroides sp. TaxID=162156 RepID=UPI002627EEE5|nr:sialate O-acetylesterase [uncultured Bacteroides sp.]
MRILISILLLLINATSYSRIFLPSIISDGMILQQDSEVRLWGKSDSKDTIFISPSWTNRIYKVLPDTKGGWSVMVGTNKADFVSKNIHFSQGNQSLYLNDVLFGEIWLCSGQSNMQMKMKGYYGTPINGGRQAIADSHNYNVHVFEVPRVASVEQEFDCNGEWKSSCPATVAETNANAYFFGRQLYKTLGVPVGLVVAPWGGASIVAFMSGRSLGSFSQFKLPKKGDKNLGNMTPSALYNGMINSILGYGIKGCIWYQGETNRKEPDLYRKLFKSMLADWREKWNIGNFPFIYAQIAPFDYNDGNSAYIREAQLMCQNENARAYMVSLMDVGEEHNIHPSEKETVGVRMAMSALDKVYDIEGIYSDEPIYKSCRIEDGKMIISFENASNGLSTYGKPITSFTIAGEDRVFYPAQVRIHKSEIVVFSDKVSSPVAVRYAFTDYAKGCLYNVEGCCASSFRTDNWTEETCKFEE